MDTKLAVYKSMFPSYLDTKKITSHIVNLTPPHRPDAGVEAASTMLHINAPISNPEAGHAHAEPSPGTSTSVPVTHYSLCVNVFLVTRQSARLRACMV